jgi:hypothetical protein
MSLYFRGVGPTPAKRWRKFDEIIGAAVFLASTVPTSSLA